MARVFITGSSDGLGFMAAKLLIDAQREKLIGQLGELEAAERVLARYSKGTGPRRRVSAKAPATPTKTTVPAQSRGGSRTRAARLAGGKRGSSSPGDQVLALATGKPRQEIAAACKGARPNHVGVVIARHKRAGRIEERGGKLYATQSTAMEQRVPV
jgi:NAD(P)-dependent dehydrogenase (short-subunit alcohol dehydrogenase family)